LVTRSVKRSFWIGESQFRAFAMTGLGDAVGDRAIGQQSGDQNFLAGEKAHVRLQYPGVRPVGGGRIIGDAEAAASPGAVDKGIARGNIAFLRRAST
jgi:hypothetical protein